MKIELKANDKMFKVNNQIIKNDVAPLNISDRTYVPIRFISEQFGFDVEWNEHTEIVTISDRKKYFDTIEECCIDWCMYFNAMSIAIFKEMASIIYKDENGYYWETPKIGAEKEVFITPPEVRKGAGIIHSHSGGSKSSTDAMSKADKDLTKKAERPIFMVDSGGELYSYYPNQSNQKSIRKELPCDCKYFDTGVSILAMQNYFNKKYKPIANECHIGYIADFYNNMYINGTPYYKFAYIPNTNQATSKKIR